MKKEDFERGVLGAGAEYEVGVVGEAGLFDGGGEFERGDGGGELERGAAGQGPWSEPVLRVIG